jgi:hypothetical protein
MEVRVLLLVVRVRARTRGRVGVGLRGTDKGDIPECSTMGISPVDVGEEPKGRDSAGDGGESSDERHCNEDQVARTLERSGVDGVGDMIVEESV